MTEEEWGQEILKNNFQFLWAKLSDRKLRLFACAACRSLWDGEPDELERIAVEVAEGFADGRATEAQLQAIHNRVAKLRPDWAAEPGHAVTCTSPVQMTLDTVKLVLHKQSHREVKLLPLLERYGDRKTNLQAYVKARSRALGPLWRLLCEILPPESALASFNPAWSSDTAVAIVSEISATGHFGAMPILADALQDAGCDSDDVLNHCRDASQVHVRGCWVVDLVLGKQ